MPSAPLAGFVITFAAGLCAIALLGGLAGLHAGRGFNSLPALAAVASPSGVAQWTTTVGLIVLAVLGGLATAATLAARRGIAPAPKAE